VSFFLADYRCDACLMIHESLEDRPAPEARECPMCGEQAERIISGTYTGTVYGRFVTGKSDERPPGAMDTRPLAEGMPHHEWRELRRGQRMDELREGLVDTQQYSYSK
jgi:hypothetical protein